MTRLYTIGAALSNFSVKEKNVRSSASNELIRWRSQATMLRAHPMQHLWQIERFANGRHTHNDPQTNQNNPNRSLGLRRRQRLASRSPWCVPPLAADTFLPSRTFPQSVFHLDYRVATVPPVP